MAVLRREQLNAKKLFASECSLTYAWPVPPRAPALKPEDRRRAIVRATLPLIQEKGPGVSTAEIARAAGVAEGTLFRAFANKGEIIDAVFRHLMDPADMIEELAAIDLAVPLRTRMVDVVGICHAKIAEISRLMSALHASGEFSHARPAKSREQHHRGTLAIVEAVAGVLAPDADRLTLSPMETASLLRSLAFATSHPFLSDGVLVDPELIVDVLLHGVLREER